MSVTVDQLVAVARRDLLVSGGVDNWNWYRESLNEHGYVPSDDIYIDAENWFNALDLGGIDGWDWYGDSLEGLDEYEEYLETLEDLSDAPSIYVWRDIASAAAAAAAEAAKPAEVEEPVVVEKRGVRGETEQKLHDLIAAKFGTDAADDLFVAAIEAGVWKHKTFPKEFAKAVKVIQQGVEDPLEKASAALFAAVVKNGKMDEFLSGVAAAAGVSAKESAITPLAARLAAANKSLAAAQVKADSAKQVVGEELSKRAVEFAALSGGNTADMLLLYIDGSLGIGKNRSDGFALTKLEGFLNKAEMDALFDCGYLIDVYNWHNGWMIHSR